MTCTSSSGYFQWSEQVPISLSEWRSILTRLSSAQTTTNRISSSSDRQHRNNARSTSRQYQNPTTTTATTTQKQSRHAPKNQIFNSGSVVDSFVASSSSIIQSTFSSRQDGPKTVSPPTKRYVSSFKTLVNATNSKHTQRLNYISDSVIILKLSKEKDGKSETTDVNVDVLSPSSKFSSLSIASTTTIQANTSSQQQQQSYPPTLSPILRVEGQKRRTLHHDPPLVAPTTSIDMAVASSSTTSMTTTGTTSHPPSNSSLFTYRSGAIGGTGGGPTLRQRQIAETTSNSLLITAERLKSNMTSSMRPARQPATTMPSSFFPSQQRNVSQTSRARIHQDKIANSRELYEYPDPFTSCPQDIMNKLAQLTKLQLETIEWEKKRRFTKKKTVINGAIQGKDSP